eukprot:Amastigsp_a843300_14.p2 type:complete len:284 gc:universal Amastigsp_a843300_14:1786-935(-)
MRRINSSICDSESGVAILETAVRSSSAEILPSALRSIVLTDFPWSSFCSSASTLAMSFSIFPRIESTLASSFLATLDTGVRSADATTGAAASLALLRLSSSDFSTPTGESDASARTVALSATSFFWSSTPVALAAAAADVSAAADDSSLTRSRRSCRSFSLLVSAASALTSARTCSTMASGSAAIVALSCTSGETLSARSMARESRSSDAGTSSSRCRSSHDESCARSFSTETPLPRIPRAMTAARSSSSESDETPSAWMAMSSARSAASSLVSRERRYDVVP